jgi:RNA polymerase sporulation-specific sigma factor
MKDVGKLSEEELIALACAGDEAALGKVFSEYRELIKSKANSYYLIGGDKEDLVQEGMIGLFWAIMHYDESKEAAFRTFAYLCIRRQMINAVKADGRYKHTPLNTFISIYDSFENEDGVSGLEEYLSDPAAKSPEELLLMQEDLDNIERASTKLFSKLELDVWSEFRRGKTYTEIAVQLGKPPKSIDNTIQRIKKKIANYTDVTIPALPSR